MIKTQAAQKSSGNQKLLTYLQAHNLVPQSVPTITTIPLSTIGLKEKILSNVLDMYQYFSTDLQSMVALCNFLITIVQNIYMQDYLGATGAESSAELENQTKEFFDAVQKEASSLQNPSSAYVG